MRVLWPDGLFSLFNNVQCETKSKSNQIAKTQKTEGADMTSQPRGLNVKHQDRTNTASEFIPLFPKDPGYIQNRHAGHA